MRNDLYAIEVSNGFARSVEGRIMKGKCDWCGKEFKAVVQWYNFFVNNASRG